MSPIIDFCYPVPLKMIFVYDNHFQTGILKRNVSNMVYTTLKQKNECAGFIEHSMGVVRVIIN